MSKTDPEVPVDPQPKPEPIPVDPIDPKIDPVEEKIPDVVKGEVKLENKDDFIPEKGNVIKDHGQKYATMTLNKKAISWIFAGLAKMKTAVQELDHGPEAVHEIEEINQLINEFQEMNNIMNEEVLPKGLQEPNPVVNPPSTEPTGPTI